MARRRLTIKRLDPWSVLKFGIVANIVMFAVLMLFSGIVWYIIDRLQLVDQACSIAIDVGFSSCGINAGNLFRALALLGGMGVIVGTAVWVFGAFLYNLIADLTGGLTIGVVTEEVPSGRSERAGYAPASGGRAGWQDASAPHDMAAPATGAGIATAHHRDADAHEAPAHTANDVPEQQPVGSRGASRGRRRRAEGDQLFGDG